jgi:6-pyruvoyltetrahydropterin/6-carboxytetrahydropterin synthase
MGTIVSKQIEFDMGHRVPNHKSKCKNLHGHRYKVEAGVEGIVSQERGASNEGMVIDFGDLKQVMMTEIHDRYDHGLMVYQRDEFRALFDYMKKTGQNIHTVPFIPTAENLAEHFYKLMKDKLTDSRMDLKYVKVWETPTSTANFYKCSLETKVNGGKSMAELADDLNL